MRRSALVMGLCLALAIASAGSGKIIYVDDDAPSGGDGKSWATAYRYLQDALADAKTADKPVEIRVGQGIYKPDQGASRKAGDRLASFALVSGMVLKGGYAGITTADPNAQDVKLYETILSGDLAGNDVVVDDPCDLETDPTRAENSYHVVYMENADGTVVLEAFTVTGGYAWLMGGAVGDYVSEYAGGGLRCRLSQNPTIAKCVFKANFARAGGGVSTANSSNVKTVECTFTANAAHAYGGGMDAGGKAIIERCTFLKNLAGDGGGMSTSYAQTTLKDCHFLDNSARTRGGALWVVGGAVVSSDCIFKRNSAQWGGAIGVYVDEDSLLTNCLFEENVAGEKGGAIDGNADKELLMQNCTFVKNSSPNGNALSRGRNLAVNSCLLRDGGREIWDISSVIVSYSDVQGGCAGTGNIDADPLFADADNGDYHLRSQAGRWDPISQTWVEDPTTSPCIDRGDPRKPIGLEPFPNGGRINIGYYGGTTEASKSYVGGPACEKIIAGDVNGDCRVDSIDLAILAYHWLERGE